jgi:hypothetical protein
MATRKS